MSVRVKSEEWLNMKSKVMKALETFSNEFDKIAIPFEDDDFELIVDGCKLHPTFVKKGDYLKVEYDFTLCNIEIRTLSIYVFNDVYRIEFTIKNQ